jgi:integrase
VKSGKKSELGYHKVATIKRRISTLSKHHKSLNYIGTANPCGHPEVLALVNNAKKLDEHASRPSLAAVKDIVETVMKTIPDDLSGLRDKAMMYVAFGAGGRRRSELVGMRFEHIKERLESCYIISIKGAKNQKFADEELLVKIEGNAKYHLDAYLDKAAISEGYIFRALKPNTTILTDRGLSSSQFYRIVKKRFIQSGVQGAQHFTPHSFRAGFVTEQGKRGKNKYDGMAMTGHRSQSQYDQYYQSGMVINNEATDLE